MTTSSLYIDQNSFIHRLDPRTKLSWLIMTIVISFLVTSIEKLSIVAILYLLILIYAVTAKKLLKIPVILVLPWMIAGITIAHGFLNPVGETPVEIGNYVISLPLFGTLTQEGLMAGLLIGVRLACITFTALILVLTTHIEDMTISISRLGIPYQHASLIGMSIKMIPIIQDEARIIIQAQRARALKEDNLLSRVRSLIPLFVPLATGSIQRAETTAMVLEARAYGSSIHRTELRSVGLKWFDYFLIILSIMIAIFIITNQFRMFINAL